MHTHGPSPHYLSAAQDIAIELGLDVAMVANGHAVAYRGLYFWLGHDQSHPGVMAVMVEIGKLPVAGEAQVCRQLLQQHYAGYPLMQGCYCLLPGTDVVAYCARFDIESDGGACADAFTFIEQMAAQKEAVSHARYQGENRSTQPLHEELA